MLPGRLIRLSNPVAPMAASTAGTTSLRWGSGAGSGVEGPRSRSAVYRHGVVATAELIAAPRRPARDGAGRPARPIRHSDRATADPGAARIPRPAVRQGRGGRRREEPRPRCPVPGRSSRCPPAAPDVRRCACSWIRAACVRTTCARWTSGAARCAASAARAAWTTTSWTPPRRSTSPSPRGSARAWPAWRGADEPGLRLAVDAVPTGRECMPARVVVVAPGRGGVLPACAHRVRLCHSVDMEPLSCRSTEGTDRQPATMESPCTVTALAVNGLSAGPWTTAPSRLNLLP